MRGGPLSHPDVLKTLKPFVVAAWSSRPGDEPEEVRDLVRRADPRGHNISCMVLDRTGVFVGAFWPMPEGEPMGSPGTAAFVRKKIEELSRDLEKPESTKKGLTLPTAEGAGVRLFVSLKALGRAPFNYKAPTVEAVTTSDAERKALAYPDAERGVPAAGLKRWLEQLFPAAIMDSSGRPPAVSGTLTLKAAGVDGARRLALLKGEVELQMDDRAATRYRGTLEAVVTYGDGKDFTSLRGSFKAVYPKSDPRHDRPLEFQMTAAIESTPE